MSKIYVFDVDGTLMDINHRRHFVENEKKKDFKSFFAAMDQDTPRQEIFDLANFLAYSKMGHGGFNDVIVVSGRNERHREITEKQLELLEYKTLILRPDDNYEPDYVFKQSVLDMLIESDLKPDMVFDDRPSVIAMWRKNGIECCDVGGWNDSSTGTNTISG